ncbi:hypothetical protein R9X47_10915 [Wukongibacter baidiensis]|uniref:hypothetical protein n=1 Tax=Wukongibacter baidiensis TaxID=1723361 RepID=UPI003D7F3CD7
MYLYKPKKRLKFKNELDGKKNKRKNKNYLKQQNLNLRTVTPDNIDKLQNKIGNKQALIFLREIGDLELREDNLVNKISIGEITTNDDIPDNEAMETKKEIQDFKKLSYKNTLASYDAVKSGRLTVDHNNSSKPNLRYSSINNNLKGLIQMSNFLKSYDPRLDKKKEEIKLGDKLIGQDEKKKRSEVESIIHMIRMLPSYDNNEDAIEAFMKAQNFLISSGCSLNELFKHNGNIRKQKEILLKAIDRK